MQRHYPKLKHTLTFSSAVLLFSLVVLGAVIAPPQRAAYAFFSDTETIDITFSINDEVTSNYLKNLLGWAEFVKNKLATAQAFAAGIIDLKINGTDEPQVVNFSGMSPGVWGDYAFTLSVALDQGVYYILKPVYQEGSEDLFNILSMELYNGDDHLLTAPLQDLISWCGLFQPESSDSFTVRIQKRANQNFTDINGSTRFYLMITAVQATNNPDFCSSTNNPPTLFDLTQFNGSTSIGEGGIIRNSSIGLFAYINDPENNQVKLQVELRQLNEPFTGNDDGGILTSDLVASGSGVKVNRAELSDGTYHWRARAVDEHENESAWQEFGSVGNTDFEIRTNELPIASFTFTPGNPKVGDEILFDASSSYDPDGTIVLYGWDWNTDGVIEAYSNSSSIKYSGLPAGTATTTLHVIDNKGGVGTNTVFIPVESTSQNTGTASISGAFCSAFGGWWCGAEAYQNEKDVKTIDEWLRDKDGDNIADANLEPFYWLTGTRCAGAGTATKQEECLMSALNTQFKDNFGHDSGLTYKTYTLSVIAEQKMVESALKRLTPGVYPYKAFLSALLKWLPFSSVGSALYNDITSKGVKDFLISSIPAIGNSTADSFIFGSSLVSLGLNAKKINETFDDIDDETYLLALGGYFRNRLFGSNHRAAWAQTCNYEFDNDDWPWLIRLFAITDATECGAEILLKPRMSQKMLDETEIKFDEWYKKYNIENFPNAELLDNIFKQGLKDDMETLIKYAIKNAPKR